MDLDEAREYLGHGSRWELRDHAFGDMELGWTFDGVAIAHGFVGRTEPVVSIILANSISDEAPMVAYFINDEAWALLEVGTDVQISRNDTTGPDEFEPGVTMPGLTLEGVQEELSK